jgi:hypothetical protein
VKTKSTRRVSKQREVEGAILNAIQKFRFEDNIRHEVILAALLNSFIFQAGMVGQPLEWFRRAARDFSAAADEIEVGFRTFRSGMRCCRLSLDGKPRRKPRLVARFSLSALPGCIRLRRTGLFTLRPEPPPFLIAATRRGGVSALRFRSLARECVSGTSGFCVDLAGAAGAYRYRLGADGTWLRASAFHRETVME